MRTRSTLLTILLILLALTFLYKVRPKVVRPSISVNRVDTIYRIDTIRDTLPQYSTRYVTHTDTLTVYIAKTEIIRDTVLVFVPIERTEYKTEDYHAIVEGYKARLTYMEVYAKTFEVTKAVPYKVKPKWGAGLQVGYGYNGKFYPYIGAGVQYNLFTW